MIIVIFEIIRHYQGPHHQNPAHHPDQRSAPGLDYRIGLPDPDPAHHRLLECLQRLHR